MSATARAATSRPVTPRGRTAATARRRPALREVPPPRPTVAGNGLFAVVVAGLLVSGMVVLLVLNTTLAQGAFEIGSLTKVSQDLAVNEQRLLQKVARAEAPEALQSRANALGMVAAPAPVFLRLADRKVLGTPVAAPGKPRAAAATTPTTTAPTTPTTTTPAVAAGTAPAARATKPTKATTTPATGTAAGAPDLTDEAVPDPPTGPADAAQPDPVPTAGASRP